MRYFALALSALALVGVGYLAVAQPSTGSIMSTAVSSPRG